MQQQPDTKSNDDNANDKKPPMEPIPINSPDPDPTPKTDAGPSNVPDSTTVDIDLNEGNSGSSSEEKNGNDMSSPTEGGLKSKKSVRWSQELVMETPIPRSSEHGSANNPYVDYSPADTRTTSFNLKGQSVVFDG